MLLLLNGPETGGGGGTPPPDGGGGGSSPPPGPPPSTGGPGSGGQGGNVAGVGQETIVWVDARGVSTPLIEASGVIIHDGPLGRMLAPTVMDSDVAAGLDGAVLRHVSLGPRNISIPVTLVGKDLITLRKVQREWARRLSPAAGDGRLQFVFADGTARELTRCRYTGGFQGDEGRANASRWHSKHVLVIQALDPYAYDVNDTIVNVAGGNQTGFFPILPFNLSSGALGTAVEIVNDGDAPAWPIWTVQGPANGITLFSNTTGETLTMPTVVLTGSQYITIDTRPRHKTITRNDGTNLYRFADWTVSRLFPLGEGTNSVVATIGGSAASTLVTARYRRAYLTAA